MYEPARSRNCGRREVGGCCVVKINGFDWPHVDDVCACALIPRETRWKLSRRVDVGSHFTVYLCLFTPILRLLPTIEIDYVEVPQHGGANLDLYLSAPWPISSDPLFSCCTEEEAHREVKRQRCERCDHAECWAKAIVFYEHGRCLPYGCIRDLSKQT